MHAALHRITLLLTLAVSLVALPATASSAMLSESEQNAIQLVIVAQLNAFAEDDADGAFATATPSVREAIGEPGRFLAMVRGAYPMVYRPAVVDFLKPEQDAGQVMQLVQLTDSHDKSWLVVFAMERQADATWRISGCVVAENRWRPA
jgi:Domain of unknown function (DUF4864)